MKIPGLLPFNFRCAFRSSDVSFMSPPYPSPGLPRASCVCRSTLLPCPVVALTLSKRLEIVLEKKGWLRPGDRVGVAVSGGADSVALLLLLTELLKHLGIVLSVVHFNHKLRGRSSDADERAVVKLAKQLEVPFHVGRADVKAKARREKSNLEDAARRARYGFFSKLVAERHVDKIAVAHTADDQAETVLAHILRGTGLAGLGGIHPVAGHVIRPLLEFRRAELRAYLRSRKQPWREDATNRDTTRLRARVRKKLLPLLERQFQPEIVQHLATLAELARDDDSFLNILAEGRLSVAQAVNGEAEESNVAFVRVPLRDLIGPSASCSAIASRMVRLIAKKLKPRSGQLGAQHVEAVLKLAVEGETGKRLPLPGGVEVCLEHEALFFRPSSTPRRTAKTCAVEFAYAIDPNSSGNRISIPQLRCAFCFRIIDWPSNTSETIDTRSVLDRDALPAPWILRNWRPGDRFRPLGHRNAHKMKQLLSKLRITGDRRIGWPVLTAGGKIVWSRGLPVAAEFAATERTRFGLVISEDSVL